MESTLISELTQTITFSPKLINTLSLIRKSISSKWSRTSLKQIEHHLISLSCQNKNLLHYKYLEEKSTNERCLTNIIEILTTAAKMSKESRENIVSLFLAHVLSHTSCYVSYETFYAVLEAVPEMICEIGYESLLEICGKLKRQQNAENFKTFKPKRSRMIICTNHKINRELCQTNLDSFLNSQADQSFPQSSHEKPLKNPLTKIPPLLIPTSKSVNSSRYSAISREEKRKGLVDFQKLACNLGEGFITAELGCLLARKRTRQVQEFSENLVLREKCMEKFDGIETERLNSSRLTMHKLNVNEHEEQEENSKKYYRKILTINSNIMRKKLPEKLRIGEWINRKTQSSKKKTEQTSHQETEYQYVLNYAYQLIDMNLAGVINLNLEEKVHKSNANIESNADTFPKLFKDLLPISQVLKELILKLNLESEKLHINMLTNRNKNTSSTHFNLETESVTISDPFLENITLNQNILKRSQGPYKDLKKLPLFKKYSEPILLYLGSWLQSLYQLADLNHPMFSYYVNNVMKSIVFYLHICNSKVANCYFVEYLFQLFLMVKRTIVEQTHPYINFNNNNTMKNKKGLIYKCSELMQNLLQILVVLLEGANKNLEKLLVNVFVKNVYFMEVLQVYMKHITESEKVPEILSTLQFYKKALETYTSSTSRKTQTSKSTENTVLYFIYQHLAEYLCPRNGCIMKILQKYEHFISPVNLDECDEENREVNGELNLLKSFKSEEHSVQKYLHEILIFISNIYYQCCPTNNDSLLVLDEEICSFYIKFSIMHFIKLYSLLTVNELANINGISKNASDQKNYENKDQPKINTKQIFMIDFIKILTSISINRTPEIAKKFRQHRVLEFFVREIELEFSVKENIEKYIKKAVVIRNVEEVILKAEQKQQSEKKQNTNTSLKLSFKEEEKEEKKVGEKKMIVPGLNLTGELFKKHSTEESKPKELNSTLTQKEKKVVVPPLKSLFRTEESYEEKREKKGALDDMVEEVVFRNKKKSFKEELNLKLDCLNFGNKEKISLEKNPQSKDVSDSNIIYITERKIRKIYSNKILHAESIMLILSLILYKGQLDPTYCDQMPIIHGKLNVLYILHYHLNHEKNKSIVSILAESVSKIKPSLSGQRLFKLLSNHYTDISHYHNWTKINAGAFGVIMNAKTQLIEPKEVAIKQMNFPKSIYERCALNDIFAEITSLEMFRLEDRVTRMYNYGVIDNTYVIVMKKYTCSLRDWRLGNVESPEAKLYPPTLPNILALFYEVIKGIKLLHEQNVTHYDIKCDNILLEFISSKDPREQPKVSVVFGDFGVAKIYEDEKDELDLKSRGTECIKSPEMLTLTLKNKKESDSYDRRKKIGTTKASDIWSLGCLLYEIVTGEFLFNSNDWVHFFMLVSSQGEDIISQQNCEKMKNNIYLIDFIKYILIRDPQHRPSIQSIICRFENLYSLLVSNPERVASSNLREVNIKSLETMISEYYDFTRKEQKSERTFMTMESNKRFKSEVEFGRTGKVMEFFNPKFSGKMVKIMEDMYFCERESTVLEYEDIIKNTGITHIIIEEKSKINKNIFKVIEVESNFDFNISLVYKTSPRVSDILREVLLFKGKLLFVNSESNFCINLLIFTLSYWFKCTAYETWCLINTQILEFPPLNSSIVSMSKAVKMLSSIEEEVQEMPKLQCICGSVTIILKKKFQEKRGELKVCKCKKNKSENSGCFSRNCHTYLEFLKKRYNIVWDHLTWTFIQNNHLLTPLFDSNTKESISTQIMLNSADPLSNMISESQTSDEWNIYQCKVCEMWMLGTNGKEIWLILNNLIKSSRQGIMIPNAQQDFKARTPNLINYTLSKLHMTSQ